MEPFIQREGISKAGSSSDDSLEPGGQCWEQTWTPVMQPIDSHYRRGTTQPNNPDALRHVHAYALEDIYSNFDTAVTSISLPGTKEASPATLANDLLTESDDFETWLKAFGTSPNIEDGLVEPESSKTPLFRERAIHPTFSENSIGEGYYYSDTVIHDSLPSAHLCLANTIPDVMSFNPPSATKPVPTSSISDDSERPNSSEMRYQLVRRLAPAAEAQFMTHGERTANDISVLEPATELRIIRQRFDPLKRKKTKEVRRLGACLRCRMYKEPCDQNTPCARCVQKVANARLFKQPCYRESLDNVVPFRLGCASLGQVRATLPTFTWSSDEPTLKIVRFLGEITPLDHSSVVTFECRRFIPATGDKIDLEWRAGDTVAIVKRPPYAIYDLEKAFNSIEAFLNDCQPTLEALISETTNDEILALSLAEANRYSEQYDNPVIRSALKVRKFAARRLRIQNPELAVQPPVVDDENCKRHQLGYAAETLGTSTYRNVDYVTRHYLAEWEYSAGVLITHFRCILRGQIPFLQSPEEASKSHARAGLDARSMEYLQKITVIARNQNQEATATRVPEENEYKFRGPSSWTSLLFSDN